MKSCWEAASTVVTPGGDVPGAKPYSMRLPVVDCGSGTSVENCVRVVGAVNVNMLFMSAFGSIDPDSDAPILMQDADDKFDAFTDWSWPGSCNDTGRDFTSLVTDPPLPVAPDPDDPTLINALDSLNNFLLPDGTVSLVTDRWLAYPTNPADQRWKGSSVYTEGMARWDCFVDHFGLINTNGQMAPMSKKSMYFMPDCNPQEPGGETSGSNFGVLAEYPALVCQGDCTN